MKVSLVSSTILILAACLDSVSTTHGPVVSCCLQCSSTKVRVERIKDYYIQQEGACPITAIVFKTLSGNRICSEPNDVWAKRTMKRVDARKRTNAGGLPTTAAPKTINAGGLGTSAPPKTINAGGLGTSAPPKTINAGGLVTPTILKKSQGGRRQNGQGKRNRKGKGKGRKGRRTSRVKQ